MNANESVQARVAELQDRAAERAVVTTESPIREAEEARVAAMQAGQIGAVVAAVKEKGVLAGLRVKQAQTSGIIHVVSAEPMSAEEWMAKHGASPDVAQ